MGKFEITDIQRLYLLYLYNNSDKNNITSVARQFNCTKPNSKKILDNMVKEGYLYKDNLDYQLTKIGKNVAEDLEKERKGVKVFLETGLNLSEKESLKNSYKFLDSELDNIRNLILMKSNLLNRFGTNVDIKHSKINEKLGQGEYQGSLFIQKLNKNIENSYIEPSMAMLGFERNVRLLIGNKSYVELESKSVSKTIQGFVKRGIVVELYYIENGVEKLVKRNDKKFLIPLEVFKTWQILDRKILYSSAYIKTNSKISFAGNHKNIAIFNVFIDLINLKKVNQD